MSSNVYDDVTGFEVCGFPEIKNFQLQAETTTNISLKNFFYIFPKIFF